ncbi:IMP dehydrogenase [uncultured Brachyspira sp.]|uniref:IMP dehydrogenase n=1 Tax=uncultured Brachyspira sp. TaxID=221953 RepID=UPI0025EC6E33|nr:IMP dehydrogenase [uncultured Brachyspira sp.]
MPINIKEALTFDDVLLVPKESDILPKDVSLKRKLTKRITLNTPLISSPMDTITESKMAIAMGLCGALGVIHKNMSLEQQAKEVETVKSFNKIEDKEKATLSSEGSLIAAAAIGISEDRYNRIEKLIEAKVDVIVIDTAHGHSKNVLNAIKEIKNKYSQIDIIAGNIATADGAKALIDAGVDAIKIGIGAGSICTTRIIAGVGVPQFTAVSDASEIAKKNNVGAIADGGIKYSGDIVKAFAAGADAIMAGGLFSSTYEAPGDVIIIDGKKYKSYRGMGSVGAMIYGSKDRYFQSEVINKSKFVPEGIEGVTEYKGHIADVVYQIVGGIRAGMGYIGAKDIETLQKKAEFIRITNQGLAESHVHDVKITSKAPNY